MRSKLFGAVTAAVLAGVIAALAANTTFFTSVGDIVFPFSPPTTNPAGPGTIDNMTIGATTPRAGTFTTLTATQVNAALGSYSKNPASSTYYPAYTFAHGQTLMTFDQGGTATYAYFTLEASPYDGQESCIFTKGAVTTLYVYANVGQSIVNAATSLAANGRTCYTYSLANTTWSRSQ
jgi:hypothetical protein